jgi:hypothetical protein
MVIQKDTSPFTVRTVNKDGTIVSESVLKVMKGNVLVQQIPSDMADEEILRQVHEALSVGADLITLPHAVQWNVLDIDYNALNFDDGEVE